MFASCRFSREVLVHGNSEVVHVLFDVHDNLDGTDNDARNHDLDVGLDVLHSLNGLGKCTCRCPHGLSILGRSTQHSAQAAPALRYLEKRQSAPHVSHWKSKQRTRHNQL